MARAQPEQELQRQVVEYLHAPVVIELRGPPRGKGRPRATVGKSGFARVYTDAKTVSYEAQLRHAATEVMGDRVPTDQPVEVTMTVRFAVPQSWSKKKQADALANRIRPCTKPDADNSLKLLDAINGVVVVDDKQVVDAHVHKVYAAIPGLLIEVREARSTVEQR